MHTRTRTPRTARERAAVGRALPRMRRAGVSRMLLRCLRTGVQDRNGGSGQGSVLARSNSSILIAGFSAFCGVLLRMFCGVLFGAHAGMDTSGRSVWYHLFLSACGANRTLKKESLMSRTCSPYMSTSASSASLSPLKPYLRDR